MKTFVRLNLVLVLFMALPVLAQAQGINQRVADLETLVEQMSQRVADLEAAVTALQGQAGTLPAPAYDSGWQAVDQTETIILIHNLNVDPENMVVNVQFLASAASGAGINNAFYGTGYTLAGFKGAYWWGLTNTMIRVFREEDDESAERVRVRIWIHR